LVSCFKDGYVSTESFANFIEIFDRSREMTHSILNTVANSTLADNISAPKQ